MDPVKGKLQLTENIIRRVIPFPVSDTIRALGTTAMGGDILYEDSFWDDLVIDISSVKFPATQAPQWVAYRGSYVLAFSPSSDEIMYFIAQLLPRFRVRGKEEARSCSVL